MPSRDFILRGKQIEWKMLHPCHNKTMLHSRHRPDKENQVLRPPKTPGPGKSIISKNPPKTPFHDENHAQTTFRHTTVKKSVAFGQSVDTSKFDAFQTPGASSWVFVLTM